MYDGNLLPCNLLFSFFDAGVNKYDCRFSNIDYILKKLRFNNVSTFLVSYHLSVLRIFRLCILNTQNSVYLTSASIRSTFQSISY